MRHGRAGFEFLGELGTNLRDLQGLDTLIYELVQNADDAPGATAIRFDVDVDGLVVWNDGVFSDCGMEDDWECALVKQDGRDVRCDFHSFKRISGQAKRDRTNTTGAFGIGFTSVFQVTDHPEVISGGRHWILHYERSEDRRIDYCDKCTRAHDAPGTSFVLPWATNPASEVRRGLKVAVVASDVCDRLVEAAREAIPAAMVFLRNIRRIELRRSGQTVLSHTRTDPTERTRRIVGLDSSRTYFVTRGDFTDAAEELRKDYEVLREDVREPGCEIAIPINGELAPSPLYAVLPTRQLTQLRFLVSASFYPYKNRKAVKFEDGYDGESEWNRAAVRGIANILIESLPELPALLGAERLWHVIRSIQRVARDAQVRIDVAFADLWKGLVPALRSADILLTSSGQWVKPINATSLAREHDEAIPVLEQMGVSVVHPKIRSLVDVTPRELGVESVSIHSLMVPLEAAGLTETIGYDELDGALADERNRAAFLRLLSSLLGEKQGDERIDVLDGRAVVPCLGNGLACPEVVATDNGDTADLLRSMPGLLFVDYEALEPVGPRLLDTAHFVAPWQVVATLGELRDSGELDRVLEELDAPGLLRWLAQREDELDEEDRSILRGCPIFPTKTGFRPLEGLALLGTFDRDPLGRAQTVDLTGIEDLRDFLGPNGLGAPELSFEVYVRDVLAPAFSDPQFHPTDRELDELIEIAVDNMAALDSDAGVRGILSGLPILPSRDGVRRAADACYFAGEDVKQLLVDPPIVVRPEGSGSVVDHLYKLLGVAGKPRPKDILSAVTLTTAGVNTHDARNQIRRVIEFLGPQFKFSGEKERTQKKAELEKTYPELLETSWLPVMEEAAWAAPHELFRTEFRRAFETAARFLDLPQVVQEHNADFLQLLEVGYRPDCALVVEHLMESVDRAKAVHSSVYEFLDRYAKEPYLEQLQQTSCLLVRVEPEVIYAAPVEVVRRVHPLGAYLYTVPADLLHFDALLDGLGVEIDPSEEHALRILQRISSQYEADDEPISADVEAEAVLHECWRIISRGLADAGRDDERLDLEGRILEGLSDIPCFPNKRHRLRRPSQLLIGDRPELEPYLPADVRDLIVEHPGDASEPLRLVGLRAFSEVLERRLFSAPAVEDNRQLTEHLGSRARQLERVVAYEGAEVARARSLLSRLSCVSARVVNIEQALVIDDEYPLGKAEVPAFIDAESEQLYVVDHITPDWETVALELAPLLCPDSREGSVAALIEKALAARSTAAADEVLSRSHIPLLSAGINSLVAEESDTRVFAEDDEAEVEELPEWDELTEMESVGHEEGSKDESESSAAAQSESLTANEESPWEQNEDTSAGENGERSYLGGDDDSLEPARTSGDDPHTGSKADGIGTYSRKSSKNGQPSSTKGRPNRSTASSIPWRVWVSGGAGAAQDEREKHASRSEHSRRVEERGVERVLQYEREHGRPDIKVMPPNHKGYDVESRAAAQKPVARRIEIKSLGGEWRADLGGTGNVPQLTSSQFDQSGDDGRHWLYVVEHALDDSNWIVYPIQAVGKRANRFLFDHGWKQAAERAAGPGLDESGSPQEAGEPSLPSVETKVFGREDRDHGDVPYLNWSELLGVGDPDLEARASRWFTSPVADVREGDFAIQQREAAMGPSLPTGSIAVFRPVNGSVPNGALVLANVAAETGDPLYVIRRAFPIRGPGDGVEGLILDVDIPGSGEPFEFRDPDALDRVLAALISFQNP